MPKKYAIYLYHLIPSLNLVYLLIDMNIVENPPRKPRNFYEKIPAGIPDNHVDQFFLMGLIEKSSFPNLHYLPMVRQTVSVVHVLNAIFLLLVSFSSLKNRLLVINP